MFKVGDRVTWSSQAGGYTVEKTGEVVLVVPAKSYPRTMLLKDPVLGRMTRTFDGICRNHESYLVAVRPTEKSAKVLYWPRVKGLRLVEAKEG